MSEQDRLEAHNAERAARAAHEDEMWEKVASDTKDLGCPRCGGEERYGWLCPKCADDEIGRYLALHKKYVTATAALREAEAALDMQPECFCAPGKGGFVCTRHLALRAVRAALSGEALERPRAREVVASESTSASVWACAYNAAVNYGSERAHKKMVHLIEALNRDMREEGRRKLQALVDAGVIEPFKPCPDECHMRPGGLFHVDGCENDANHPVSRARERAAQEKLPGGSDGWAGWRAACVELVGRGAA